MNWVTAICIIFFLSSVLYGESYARSTTLFDFMIANCGPNLSKKDHTLIRLSSMLCSESSNPECQSDCKLLLHNLQPKCQFLKEDAEFITKEFQIPKRCFDHLAGRNEVSTNNSLVASQYSLKSDTLCNNEIPIGNVLSKPCIEVIGENFEGDVQVFCSSTGNIIKDTEQCRYNQRLLQSMTHSIQTTKTSNHIPVNYDQSVGDFIQKVNTNIQILEGIGNVLKKTGVKELVSLVSSVGSFLGPIGAIFSFLGSLFPAENKEHKELLNRLDQLEVKINEVSSKIDDLTIHVSNSVFMSEFRQNTIKLVNLEHDIRRYVNSPSNLTRDLLVKRCMDNPAAEMVQWFLHIVQNIDHYGFANMFSFDRNEYNNKFGKPALAYIVRSISAKIKCVGVLSGSQQDIDNFARDLQQMARTIGDVISYTYDQYIPDYAISQTLERDVIDMLRRYQGQSNEDVSKQMFDEVQRKYDYFYWGVNSYNDVTGSYHHLMSTYCFKCAGRGNSGSYWVYRSYGRNVNLMYTKRRHGIPSWQRSQLGDGRPGLDTKLNQMFSFSGVRNGLAVRWGNGLRSFFYSDFMLFHNVDGYATFVLTA